MKHFVLLAALCSLLVGASVAQDPYPFGLDWVGDGLGVGPGFITGLEIFTNDPDQANDMVEKHGTVNRLTDNFKATFHYVYFNEGPLKSSADGAFLIRTAGNVSTQDNNGVIIRQQAGKSILDVDHEYIIFRWRGDGIFSVREMLGEATNRTFCNPCTDVGAAIGANDYLGIQWYGTGEGFIVKVWNFQDTPPADFFDATTWGTDCDGFIWWDTPAAASGCDSDWEVMLLAEDPAWGSGDDWGLFHHDGAAGNVAGFRGVWTTGEEQ